MTEARLRQILADWFKCQPDDITDATCVGNPATFDSLAVMNLTLSVEPEIDRILTDDEIASLVSWPAIKSVILGEPNNAPVVFYKTLVLDADGTLWGGTLDEEGATPTVEFSEAQHVFLGLKERGVILCLASKNDESSLEAALRRAGKDRYGETGLPTTPYLPLSPEDFTVIRAGWGNKVASLKAIAKTLNIGLDAIVFVDDSPFECAYVTSHLPEVKVVQVPADLSKYPAVAREIADLFPKMIDTSKTAEYHALAAAEKTRPQFSTEEEFLASLGIEVELHCNREDETPRISELTQKANQFNLTTQRYTEDQIREWMDRGYVWSINVKDKFGDQGLVGVVIVADGRVDTFLLSCRILGRGLEKAIWGPILDTMREIGWKWIMGRYIPTPKNEQVQDLWRDLGFESYVGGEWAHALDTLDIPCPSWIKVRAE